MEKRCWENVKETVYLGLKLGEDGKMGVRWKEELEWQCRQWGQWRRCMRVEKLGNSVWSSGNPNTNVWVLPEREKSRLQATEMRMLRKIAGVSRLEEYHTGPDQLKDMILILSYNGGCMQNQAKTWTSKLAILRDCQECWLWGSCTMGILVMLFLQHKSTG